MMNSRKWSTFLLLSLTALVVVALPAVAEKKGETKEAAPAAAPAASSSTATAQGGYKIGVVDIEQVVEGYPKKQRLMDDLQAKVKIDQDAIDAQTSKLESLQKAYDAGKENFSDADKSAKQAEMRSLVTDIKSSREKKQGEIDQKEAEIKKSVFDDVSKAIQQIAESENYHLVLNARNVPNGSVLYASKTIDITAKVVTQLGSGK